MALVLGLLLAADYAVVAGTHHTLDFRFAEQWAQSWKCPLDELEEENVSLAECHAMAARVEALIVARPAWFAPAQIALGVAGGIAALLSAVAAIGLIDRRRWAAAVFFASVMVLLAIEAAQLALATNAGPLLRSDYLWKYFGWLVIHVGFVSALVAGMHANAPPTVPASPGHSRAVAVLHFATAVGVFYLYAGSWWLLALPWGKARGFPTQMHKNVGLTIVLLLVLLLYVRLRRRPPPLERVPPWVRRAAGADHVLVYALGLVAAVSGYLSSAFSGWGTRFWWIVDLPDWGWEDETFNQLFSNVHALSAWALLLLVVAHIAGALYHAVRNDGLVRRMLHW